MRTRESFATLSVQTVIRKNLRNQSSSRRGGVGLDLILESVSEERRLVLRSLLTYHNALGIIRDRGFSTLALAETEDNELDLEKIEAQFRRCQSYLLSRTDVFESLFRKSRYLHP